MVFSYTLFKTFFSMKRLFLSTAAVALLFATACTSETTEETNVNATDTIQTMPPADNTGPGIEGANPDMTNPNGTSGNGSGTMNNSGSGGINGGSNVDNNTSGSATGSENSANTNAANDNRGSSSREQTVVVPPAPAKDANRSTYRRAAPGDSVDSRTNMGSSR